MNEIQFTYLAFVKLLIAAIIGFVYARAGRGWKLWGLKIRRRVYLPSILILSQLIFMIILKKFTWMLLGSILLSWIIYYGTLSIGYGAGSPLRKWFGRIAQQFIVGFLQASSAILIAICTQKWGIYILGITIGTLTLGFLGGIFDKDVHAPIKEALCGISLFLFPLFLI